MGQNMTYILYCGANMCQRTQFLVERYNNENGLFIHYFEPNTSCNESLVKNYLIKNNVNYIYDYKAVWIYDGKIDFQLQKSKVKAGEVGQASALTVVKNSNYRLIDGKINLVDCIDLSRIIKELNYDRIILKLDVEGAEFEILNKLISDETILKIKDLYLEIHRRYLKHTITKKQRIELVQKIKDLNINILEDVT